MQPSAEIVNQCYNGYDLDRALGEDLDSPVRYEKQTK